MAQNQIPHVLIFPFQVQGHINSMLNLAELLSLAGLQVTFLNTEYNHNRILRCTDAQLRFARFPGFRFKTITDGLPLDHPRSLAFFEEIVHAMHTYMPPAFRELLFSGCLESAERAPVTCIIADGLFSFAIDVANELGITSISYSTTSACYFWALFSLPKLIEAGDVPFGEEAGLDDMISSVPGMEGFLRRKDLPTFCRAKELKDVGLQLVLTETQNSIRASAHIINTFDDLERPILSRIQSRFPQIYTLGPLHALLNSRRRDLSLPSFSNSHLEVDRSCMTWLDSQESNAVIYVSFGSVVFITQKQMFEIWHGLVNSGKQFLWAIRPDSVIEKNEEDEITEELQEGTKERGCIVEWSPQEEVLKHQAVGAFLTHSGWNSTLETVVLGVPMICCPQFADQQINSRFVSEAWKLGLDMSEKCDRSTVERMVRDVMENRREEIMKSVDKMAEMARRSVGECGSSYNNMDRLIQDIKLMSLGKFDPKF